MEPATSKSLKKAVPSSGEDVPANENEDLPASLPANRQCKFTGKSSEDAGADLREGLSPVVHRSLKHAGVWGHNSQKL